jgi:hypothetical protein
MTSRLVADWQTIRTLYEQGDLSNRELARRYAPLTEGAIRKRAKKEFWTRPDRAKAPRVLRAGRRDPRPWRHWEAAARRIMVDPRDRTKPVGNSPEEILEVAESATAAFLDNLNNIIQNRETLIENLEHCAEEYHVPYREYLKMRKQFEMPALGRQLRCAAEIFKGLASARERLSRSAYRKS